MAPPDQASHGPDDALVRACLAGNAAAWETLIRRYRRLVYSIPVAYRLPAEDADEVFQSVALKLFRHLGSLRDTAHLTAWLVVTTRRECQAVSQKRRGLGPVPVRFEAEPSEAPRDLIRELHEIRCEHTLALALERLDEGCRTLLHALFVEQPSPSYEELGRRLDRPVGSLGPTRGRCLEKLRGIYLSLGGEAP